MNELKIYANTFPSYFEDRLSRGLIPWIKIGQTLEEDVERYLKKNKTQNPEKIICLRIWLAPSCREDKDFHHFLEVYKNIPRLRLGGGTEWFEVYPELLDSLYEEWVNNLNWYQILRAKEILENAKEGESKHINSITDVDWTLFCLKNLCVKRYFKSLEDLQWELLKLDKFNIYGTGMSAVRCAVQPFVVSNSFRTFKRSSEERQWASGVRIRYRKRSQVVVEIKDEGGSWDQL